MRIVKKIINTNWDHRVRDCTWLYRISSQISNDPENGFSRFELKSSFRANMLRRLKDEIEGRVQ